MADYYTEILPREQEAAKKQFMADTTAKLRQLEGFSPVTEIPTPGDKPTIGHGHTGPRAVPGAKIGRPEAQELLEYDVETRIPEVAKLTPGFGDLTPDAQKAIMSSHFRGSWKGSPKTRELFNEGKYEAASKEYLNNNEYKNAVALGRAGIRPRMEEEAAQIKKARFREAVDEPAGFFTGNISQRFNKPIQVK